mmetsp:Transcript_15055/g.56738  ORF Transcript_15055/g.56738 Transcript_15055/m.56738 type:complete len:273 (-) Transcript_15055:336-1154(-)
MPSIHPRKVMPSTSTHRSVIVRTTSYAWDSQMARISITRLPKVELTASSCRCSCSSRSASSCAISRPAAPRCAPTVEWLARRSSLPPGVSPSAPPSSPPSFPGPPVPPTPPSRSSRHRSDLSSGDPLCPVRHWRSARRHEDSSSSPATMPMTTSNAIDGGKRPVKSGRATANGCETAVPCASEMAEAPSDVKSSVSTLAPTNTPAVELYSVASMRTRVVPGSTREPSPFGVAALLSPPDCAASGCPRSQASICAASSVAFPRMRRRSSTSHC